METGFCKFYDSTRGYGILVNEDTKVEVFFHFSNSKDLIKSADQCTWEQEIGKKGTPIALDVRRVKTK
jgi:cold shock CspA family protein